MFTSNPFAELSVSVSPTIMQTYVVVMALLVTGGTLIDIIHKKSAHYFFSNWRKSNVKAMRHVGGGKMVSIAVQTAVVDVIASGEFCNVRRRIAHLLTMYGFVIYVVTTAIMVFAYPTPRTPAPASLPTLWYIGALMVCLGGYWFWFFIRVDVAAEGNSPFRFVRADLFIVALVLSAPTTDLVLAHKHPDDRGQVAATIDQILNTHQAFSTRHRIIDTGYNVRDIVVVGDQLFDDQGDVIGTHGFYIDVSPLPERAHEDLVTARLAEINGNRASIEQAKGMLMLIYNINDDTAFNLLRWLSQEANVKLRVLAEQISDDFRGAGLALNAQSEFDHLLLTAHRRICPSHH